jgi:hypothetical protein
VTKDGVGRPIWSPDGTMIAYCRSGYSSDSPYGWYAQLEAAVLRGRRYLGPTCGNSWQARPRG